MIAFIPSRPALPSPRHMGAPIRSDPPHTVTVRPGDTLWTLAGAQLGSAATDWEIAREWPRWHAHNLRHIGPEPGNLRPGTVLRVPPPENTAADRTHDHIPHRGPGDTDDHHRLA